MKNMLICLNREPKKLHPDVTNVYLEIMQTENDESVESLRLQESVWRWSFTQSLCSSCTSRRAMLMPESFHSSPHMWRALIFNTINHGGGFGSWGRRPLFTRLSIWLSVLPRPLSCDYEFGRLNSETMSQGGREPWPQSRRHLDFLLYHIIIAICWLCVSPFAQLHLSKRCVSNSCGNRSHTWAGSFDVWWARNTATWATGCNPAGMKLESVHMHSKQPGKPSTA